MRCGFRMLPPEPGPEGRTPVERGGQGTIRRGVFASAPHRRGSPGGPADNTGGQRKTTSPAACPAAPPPAAGNRGRLCAGCDIEPRLTPPLRPRTKGRIGRFGGRIEEVRPSPPQRQESGAGSDPGTAGCRNPSPGAERPSTRMGDRPRQGRIRSGGGHGTAGDVTGCPSPAKGAATDRPAPRASAQHRAPIDLDQIARHPMRPV